MDQLHNGNTQALLVKTVCQERNSQEINYLSGLCVLKISLVEEKTLVDQKNVLTSHFGSNIITDKSLRKADLPMNFYR